MISPTLFTRSRTGYKTLVIFLGFLVILEPKQKRARVVFADRDAVK
jgi:hypothetical protein